MESRGKCENGYEWCHSSYHEGDRKTSVAQFGSNLSREDGLQIACKPCRIKENQNRTINRYRLFPVPDKIIYGIVDANCKIIYIGESKKGPYRMYCHLSGVKGANPFHDYTLTKEELKKYSYVVIWDGTDHSKQERLMREMVLIQALKPKYNKQWNQEDEG